MGKKKKTLGEGEGNNRYMWGEKRDGGRVE